MHLTSPWIPRLAQIQAPPADRLVTALADDILEGLLEAGDRLPAHRDLAYKLKIGVGTVTKAYKVLETRGLVRSVKGSGMFVALAQIRRGPLIDLSRNAPPTVMTERLLARTLRAIAKRIDSGLFNDYPPIGGHDEHRRLLAKWFSSLGMEADPRFLLLTGGAHHAISLALSAVCRPEGTLFAEAQTYPGVIALAHHQGTPIAGVEMDSEGVMPDSLEQMLAAKRPGPAALYVTPTMQNPTTATMSLKRRKDIVAVCRNHDIMIIEDDVYTLCSNPELPPLAMLAPERTFYANSMSKTLNPTLRIGGLVVPPSMYARTEEALRATAIMVSPLSCAVMEQWLTDGTAEIIRQTIQDESKRRVTLTQSMLASRIKTSNYQGYHVWMPMPAHEALQLEQDAMELGIQVTPPASTAANPGSAAASGVRLCLGGSTMTDLRTALAAIAKLRPESGHPC